MLLLSHFEIASEEIEGGRLEGGADVQRKRRHLRREG